MQITHANIIQEMYFANERMFCIALNWGCWVEVHWTPGKIPKLNDNSQFVEKHNIDYKCVKEWG